MRVTVRFVDGEQLEGTAEHVSLDSGGFNLVGMGGNTRCLWVGAGAIKYVSIHPATAEVYERDPREADNLPKVVMHFLDGETMRTYEDTAFQQLPGGFSMRLWDAESRQLVKALVPGSSLKGLFTVDEWDSRSEAEKLRHGGDSTPPTSPEAWVEQEELFDVPPPVTSNAEERRASFGSGLTRRGRLVVSPASPEEERHQQLRARISQVLGAPLPARAQPAGDRNDRD
ncbi:MAG: hypothetical protein ABR598_04015 [Candidatus Dormibacteria bacterium]